MRRYIITLAVLFSMAGYLNAQEIMIFSLKGNATIKTGSQTIKATYKSRIPQGATLILEEGAGVSLLCSDSKRDIYTSVSLKGKASTGTKEIWKQAEAAASGVENAYFKYLWGELTHPHKDVEAYHEQHMKSKGTVVRGECSKPEMLSPALGEAVSPPSVAFYWAGDVGQIFRFMIFNEQGDKLLEILAQTPYVELIIPTFWLKTGKTYYWGAVTFDADDPCVRYPFKIIDQKERNALIQEIANRYVVKEQNTQTLIEQAFELERNGLFPEAIQLLGDKLENVPDDALLKDVYGGLLTRAGRIQEAKQFFGK